MIKICTAHVSSPEESKGKQKLTHEGGGGGAKGEGDCGNSSGATKKELGFTVASRRSKSVQ